METNLTINTAIEKFSDEKINEALQISGIKGRTPLANIIGLVGVMQEYISSNYFIDKGIKEEFYALYCCLQFNLELLKQAE